MSKLKLMTIVGTRPEVIKMSAIIKKAHQYFDHILVHTGQNYDYELNKIFFDDLGLELIFSGLNPLEKAEFLTRTLSTLDENERHLLTAYFENDMSLSGTSRQLFIHKNTLQYKLNHIFRKSGLNPRAFKDAVMLYLGLNLAK